MLRSNFRTQTKTEILLLLNLVFLFVCFVIVSFIFLFLFLLSFFFLYYQLYHHHLLILTLTPFTLSPSFVLKSIAFLSAPSYPLSPSDLTFPSHSPSPCHQTIPPSYKLITCWPTYYTNFTQPWPLQSLTQAPYTTTTEIHPNMHKDHKNHQHPHCFPHLPTPLPTFLFSATLSNSPNFYS
jgi:hypothetical protein